MLGGIYEIQSESQEDRRRLRCLVPGLPGFWSQGHTEEEALANIKDAIQGYLKTVDELTKDKEARYVEVTGHA